MVWLVNLVLDSTQHFLLLIRYVDFISVFLYCRIFWFNTLDFLLLLIWYIYESVNGNQVVVSTKSPRSDKQYVWEAAADSSSYVIKEETDPEKLLRRGTQITLHLRVSDIFNFFLFIFPVQFLCNLRCTIISNSRVIYGVKLLCAFAITF